MDKNYRYFLTIAQCGSFKKASDTLLISQPSLTVAIKKLENDMGVTLFHRRSKGVELTEFGVLLKEHVLQQQDKHLQLEHKIKDMQQRHYGKIKLGTGEAWWDLFVKKTLSEYQAIQPTSSFHLEFGNNLSLVYHLVQGEIDLVIGHEVLGLTEDTRVSFRPLFQDNEAIYVKQNHPLLDECNFENKLQNFPIIRVTPNHARHQSVLAPQLAKLGFIYEQERMQDRICYDIDSLAASIDMLNMTQAIMPYTDKMKNCLENKGLAMLSINKQQVGNIGIYTKYGVVNEKVEMFIELLQASIQHFKV